MERKELIPRLKLNYMDLRTPDEFITPPVSCSTSLKPQQSTTADNKRKFFPSVSDSKLDEIMMKTLDMSSKLQKYHSDESDSTNRSSFGLLPKECLEATQATVDETFEWTMSKSSLKMPPILQKTSSKKDVISPKESDSISIGDQYLKPTLERLTKEEADETTPLDLLLGSTMGDMTSGSIISEFDWSHINKELSAAKTPKAMSIPPPTGVDCSIDASFFKGSISGRSTSIGGAGSYGNQTRTLDEKFNDFSGLKMSDQDFGPIAKDNLALMNEEEKLLQDEDTGQAQESFADHTAEYSIAMRSQYFNQNTSRLGSLESSTVIPTETRPNLGLNIVSPEKMEPIRVLEEKLNTTFTKEDKKDLRQILSTKISQTKSTSDLKAFLTKHLEHRASKEHEQTANIQDDLVTSILEATMNLPEFTFTKSPIRSASSRSQSRIPIRSPNRSAEKENVVPNISKNSDHHKFKMPMMGMKSKLPVSKEKLLKPPSTLASASTLPTSSFKHRHSSPIKEPKKNIPKEVKPLEYVHPPSQPQKVATAFPIEANRVNLNWISIPINSGAKTEFIALKNAANANPVRVVMQIKDSEAEFTFEDGRSTKEISIEPSSTTLVSINFLPTSVGQKLGTLSLKIPGFRNSRGNAVKSSIPLRGFAGQPNFEFGGENLQRLEDSADCLKMTCYEMSNDVATVSRLLIENRGNSGGFYTAQAFLDAECKSESNWETGPIRLESRQRQLEAGQATQLLLRIDPEIVESRDVPKQFGTLVIIWGSELARKVLLSAQAAGSHKKFNQQLPWPLPTFDTEQVNASGKVVEGLLRQQPNELDLKQCLSGAIFKKVIKIYGARNSQSFYALPTEETLSESMMDATIGQHEKFHQTFSTIQEEHEQQQEVVTKDDDAPEVNETLMTVESNRIFTPPVKVGDSVVVKIKVRNTSKVVAQKVTVTSQLEKPFSTSHAQFVVKPKSWINLPISYSPTYPGPHECMIELTSQTNSVVVKIKGATL